MAISAPVSCCMLFIAASNGERCSSSISRVQFSVTQMASSTTEPITRISANIVSVLMLMFRRYRNRNVPISETGIVTEGMIVARQS